MTHRMHLRGPWQYEWLSKRTPELSAPLSGRVTVPINWQAHFGVTAGKARFRRRFNKPTNLDSDERVHIVCSKLRGHVQVSVNKTILGARGQCEELIAFEITRLLENSNELEIEIEQCEAETSPQTLLWEWVAIEIRSENAG